MNDDFMGDMTKKSSPMVDFNYKLSKSRSSRRSMFQIFSPKKGSKNPLPYNNPKDIFKANNKINSILSKNLISIFKENQKDIANDIPLYENVNCLIKKSHNSNKFLYGQMFNNNKNNKKFNHKETDYLYINTISEKAFEDFDSTPSKNKLNKLDSISRTTIKNSIEIRQQLDPSIHKLKKSKKSIEKYDNKIIKKKESNVKNKFGLSLGEKTFGTDAMSGRKSKQIKKLLKDHEISEVNNIKNKKRNKSGLIQPNFNFSGELRQNIINNSAKIKNIGKNNINSNNYKKRFSSFNNKYNFKINSNLSNKTKKKRNTLFLKSSSKDLKIPTLKQIKSAITKTFIESKVEFVKKEIKDFDKNEISEIIDTYEKKKNNLLVKKNSIKSFSSKQLLINQKNEDKNENQNNNEIDDRLQKKYRKLFLIKNLYDSLDDEEVMDEEKIYNFHIATNSLTVYILDSLILIASLIELYYLPVYLSLHISSYAIYHNAISSIIFYIIDIIYIIDLITGFFRAYYNFEEILIKRNVDICINYLTGWFIFDLIEAVPFFTLLDNNMNKLRKNYISLNDNDINFFDFSLNNKYFTLTILKLIKILKIFTDNRTLIMINKILDKSQFYSEWKGLFSSLLIAFSSLHFCTCFFIFIGKNESQGWIVNNNLQNSNFMDIYVASLYYQMTTLTTVGYGDISAIIGFEKYYGIFVIIVGTCAYSWILTYISNYIKKNNEKFIDFEKRMGVLKEIKIEYPNINNNLYDRIKRYLNYTKSESKCNLKFILESLPSSLQNNLIIEIYKPIIRNFQFFKSFENSDFFVKIVTSLKPILSIKEDILIQEGDVIEDIIFIKNGVLTLEIIIDLNDPKNSIESHLEMTGLDCFKNISNDKFNALMNLSTINSNYNKEFGKQIFYGKYENKKEIKIIDLRKNEHFGDILMILNEKSPLTIKVKSKKAELFFLQKTEATLISNRYPNIWKRIVNRSLHNMKQIKSLIRKKIFVFIEAYNIDINPEIKKRYLKYKQSIIGEMLLNPNKNKKNEKDITQIETILEENESSKSVASNKNLNQSTHEQAQYKKDKINEDKKNKKKSFLNIQKNEKYIKNKSFNKDNKLLKENEKNEINLFLQNSKKNHSFKELKQNIEMNNENINGVNDVISIIDKEVKKKSNSKNQINNFNINIYTKKVQIPINQISIENHKTNQHQKQENEEINNSSNLELGKINSEISYNHDYIMNIENNDILMDNSDENSNIYFSNIKLKLIKENKNINNNDKYDLNNIKLLEKKKLEKIMNKNIKSEKGEKGEIKTNDKISIKSILSDKIKIDIQKQNDINDIPIIVNKNKFIDLDTSQSTCFTINSSYENINQISKYKYLQNSELRNITKNFILEQIDNTEKKVEVESTNININNTNKNNPKKANTNNFLSLEYNIKPNHKKLLRKKSENIPNSRKSLNKMKMYVIPPSERSSCSRPSSRIKLSKSLNMDVENENEKENGEIFLSYGTNKKTKSLKNKTKKHILHESEKTFYNKVSKIKLMQKSSIENQDNKGIKHEKETKNKNNKLNYNKIISKNIEKNQQNLNNPEEYFEGFFNDIIFKTKHSNLLDNDNNNINIIQKRTFQKDSTK